MKIETYLSQGGIVNGKAPGPADYILSAGICHQYADIFGSDPDPVKSRCCGRCNGIDDICVTDMICDDHNIQGCLICWPK